MFHSHSNNVVVVLVRIIIVWFASDSSGTGSGGRNVNFEKHRLRLHSHWKQEAISQLSRLITILGKETMPVPLLFSKLSVSGSPHIHLVA